MISNGAGFADGVLDAAAKYPDKWFWVYSALADTKGLPTSSESTSTGTRSATSPPRSRAWRASRKKIGVILAQPIPAYTHALGGVTDGVEAECGSEDNLLTTWSGTFDDNAKTKQATNALIAKGADVIIDFQDAATPGVQSAIKEHPDVQYVGTMFDWAEDVPDQIITSVAIDYEDGYVDTAQAAARREARAEGVLERRGDRRPRADGVHERHAGGRGEGQGALRGDQEWRGQGRSHDDRGRVATREASGTGAAGVTEAWSAGRTIPLR